MIEPRNETDCGGRRGFLSGGSTEVPQSPGTEALPGSKSTAYTYGGSPGTWEVLPPLSHQSGRAPEQQEPRPHFGALDTVGERRERARDGKRRAKATKRGGKGGRKSELSTVPVKQGNQPEGPCGGRGEPGYGTTGGKDAGNIESRKRLNETTADSGNGGEST